MKDTLKRIIVLGLVFVAAFFSVSLYRAWQGGHPIFGIGDEPEEPGHYAPEHATLATAPAIDSSQVPGLIRLNDEMVELVAQVTPSVVSIDTEILKKERWRDYRGQIWEQDRLTPGLGSGVIVSEEGHVITNHHVIEGHQRIRVTLDSGRSLQATLINSDKLLDIAVLRIKGQEGERFQPLRFADSDQVRVGQIAIAVGNPFGLGESVTVGRISARDRSLSDTQRDLFQTDAAINPGNSGGPLLNHLGEIIAINASIFTMDRENPSFQGIGFSIPSNDAKQAFDHIREKGRPVYGYLGFRLRELNDYLRDVFNYTGQGVVIWDVEPGGPADKAGLKPNDIVIAFDNEGVKSAQALLNRVEWSKVGTEVNISVWRGDRTVNLVAKIDELDPFAVSSEVQSGRLASDAAIIKSVGLTVRNPPVTPLSRGLGGVYVADVGDDSLAKKAGIASRDYLLEINGSRIKSAEDFYLRLVATAAVQKTRLRIIRGNQSVEVSLPRIPRTTD
ncbi:trypsin-like peptidase domain-containing protein [Akkermansiaceae bacterium]|nr:trypsin-like peptidase domain-containing protein [Akkermansiaceae bacterium]